MRIDWEIMVHMLDLESLKEKPNINVMKTIHLFVTDIASLLATHILILCYLYYLPCI